MLVAAFVLAYWLRFDFAIGVQERAGLIVQLPFVVLLQVAAITLTRAHTRSWRYMNLGDLPPFLRAFFYSTSIIVAVRLGPIETLAPLRIPLSIIVMDTLLALVGVLGIRVLRRWVDETRQRRRLDKVDVGERQRVILVGAGRAGVLAARELLARHDAGIDPVAFVDDDPLKLRSVIAGIGVLGTLEDLPELARRLKVGCAVLTIAEASAAQRRRVVSLCESAGLEVREIPGYYELLQGDVSMTRLRPVAPESLLGREPVQMDQDDLRHWIGGKRVLVTGAGGSIGSELGRQIAACTPDVLVLLERTENALFEIGRELRATWPDVRIESVLADVTDEARARGILAMFRPQLVVHAAAHKHVSLMEENACEAVKNNIQGTNQIGRLCGEYDVEQFVLISTDKAVKPTSVMGASKRMAELVVQDLNSRYETTFAAVRFGNVLGSAGSVIPIFQQQIKEGGPVTVTDPEMTRYFMSIPEAAQLVLEAGSIAAGGEIFVLDMGEPVRILDLAENMIRLSGYAPYEEIDIVITGRSRGEKLHEELGNKVEHLGATRHPKVLVGELQPMNSHDLAKALDALAALAESGDGDAIRSLLDEILPEAALELHDRRETAGGFSTGPRRA